MKKYNALQINETYQAQFVKKEYPKLKENEVLIKVQYTSINNKDVLSFQGNKGVTKVYPHIIGIDATGIIDSSNTTKFNIGDEVIVTGFDLGMNTDGGFSEYLVVNSDWVIIKPKQLSFSKAMFYGTAGLTAALSVYEIEQKVAKQNPILVTGASGGVASISIKMLIKLGYEVHALTSKSQNEEYLNNIGVSKIISNKSFIESNSRILALEQYHGIIDVVGGEILETAIKVCSYDGIIIACGNAAGFKLSTTVYPFILRGVRLIGIDSVNISIAKRNFFWNLIATQYNISDHQIAQYIEFNQSIEYLNLFKNQNINGRIVVKMQ